MAKHDLLHIKIFLCIKFYIISKINEKLFLVITFEHKIQFDILFFIDNR